MEPLDQDKLPRHVAVIMDGNGRWAKARGLPRLAGHRAGTEALRRLIEGCIEHGIPYLTIYAFSTENWMRPAHEVRGLMFLLEEMIERQLDELDANGVRLRHVGWLDGVPKHIAEKIREAVDRTAGNRRLTVNVAFNYGSRMEIIRAIRRLVEEGVPPSEIDHDRFEKYLETAGSPDPDLVIRTSGEMRLSNFLLWQVAYSEIYCTDTLWPDFDRDELYRALCDYSCRERRFGARPDSETGPAADGQSTADGVDVDVAVAEDAPARADVASDSSRLG
jgi:undecaprenyl diphosphate synthase